MDIILVELSLTKILPVGLQLPVLMPFYNFFSYQVKLSIISDPACRPH